MRIISGYYKGMRLIAPKNLPVRPTKDLTKEALFSILNNDYSLNKVTVLDLFSGTGNISYEFISRGCSEVVAVDNNLSCIQFIKKTSSNLNMNIEIIKSDVYEFLNKTKMAFDIIFADPPYEFETDKFLKIVKYTFDNKLLNEKGVLVIEHSKYTYLSEKNDNFCYSKKYGTSILSFFKYD